MEGKIAVITGSTSGIGLGVAKEFVSRGCSVVVTGLGSEGQIAEILKDLHGRSKTSENVHFLPAELRNTDSINQFCLEVDKLYPNGIDILLNIAGTQHVSHIEEFPLEVWQSMMSVGLTAPFMLIKHFLRRMKDKGWGRIINMASHMAIISDPGQTPYSTYKAGICGLTRGVALEVMRTGVTCNALCPGIVDAPMVWNQIDQWSAVRGFTDREEGKKELLKQSPNKELITIQEIADYIVFLCSDSGRNMNGASIILDGGNTVR